MIFLSPTLLPRHDVGPR